MQSVRTPLSTMLVDICQAFTGIEVPPDARVQLDEFDRLGLFVEGYRVVDAEHGRLIQMQLPPLPSGELVIPIPLVPSLAVVVSLQTLGEAPLLEILDPYSDEGYLELVNIRFGLRLNDTILRPVDGSEHVDLTFEGGVRLGRDWNIKLVGDPSLSLSSCEIGHTRLFIELKGIEFDFSRTRSLPGLAALGIGQEFKGMYARQAKLLVLPDCVFSGNPGVEVDFQDVAVGSTGVSGSIRSYYELSSDGSNIAPSSRLVGHLLVESWQVGLAAIELDFFQNEVERFFVDGLIKCPYLNCLFHISFGLQKLTGGSYRQTFSLRSKETVSAELGSGTLTIDELECTGAVTGTTFSATGHLRGKLGLPGFALDLERIEIGLDHCDSSDEFRLELEELTFGPLGQVERALLRLKSVTDPDSGDIVLDVEMAARMSWSDLRARLNLDELPAAFPLPPDDGKVDVYLSWEEDDSLVLRFTTGVEDADALWRFVLSLIHI